MGDFKVIFAKKNRQPLPTESIRDYQIVTPGQIIQQSEGFMRGHGTYVENGHIKSSVAGVVQQVNKLISVKSFKGRYTGEIGDVIVGRITEVQKKRWKVDTYSRLDSSLLLSSINLLGGELRRRCDEDEQMMRKYLAEGDLISAEVHNVFEDGSLSLYTRSLKYGKLSQGIFIKVMPYLIKRCKTHFHTLTCGATIILGNNGYIWICPTSTVDDQSGGFVQNLDMEISLSDRQAISRLRNCILALAAHKVLIYDTSVVYAYEESQKYQVRELINPECMRDLAVLTKQRLR